MKALFAVAEIAPWVKTGGLSNVAAAQSLPLYLLECEDWPDNALRFGLLSRTVA